MTTDELRAKFVEWYPDAIGDVQPFECYMKGYASRDAEVEALRKDAERYRFLRNSANISWNDWVEYENLMATDAEREQMDAAIDSAIDAAMREESK